MDKRIQATGGNVGISRKIKVCIEGPTRIIALVSTHAQIVQGGNHFRFRDFRIGLPIPQTLKIFRSLEDFDLFVLGHPSPSLRLFLEYRGLAPDKAPDKKSSNQRLFMPVRGANAEAFSDSLSRAR